MEHVTCQDINSPISAGTYHGQLSICAANQVGPLCDPFEYGLLFGGICAKVSYCTGNLYQAAKRTAHSVIGVSFLLSLLVLDHRYWDSRIGDPV